MSHVHPCNRCENRWFKSFKNLLNSFVSVSFVLRGQNTWYWLLYWEVYLGPGLRRLRSLRGWGHVLLGSGEGFLLFQNGRLKGGPAHGDETQEWPCVTNWLSCQLTQACENLSIPTLDMAAWQRTFNLNWNRVQTSGVIPLLRASAELMFPRNWKCVSMKAPPGRQFAVLTFSSAEFSAALVVSFHGRNWGLARLNSLPRIPCYQSPAEPLRQCFYLVGVFTFSCWPSKS